MSFIFRSLFSSFRELNNEKKRTAGMANKGQQKGFSKIGCYALSSADVF